MSLLAWILLGMIAGISASKLGSGATGDGVLDVAVGIFGAVTAGWLFTRFGSYDGTAISLYGLFVAIAGAAALTVGYHAALRKEP